MLDVDQPAQQMPIQKRLFINDGHWRAEQRRFQRGSAAGNGCGIGRSERFASFMVNDTQRTRHRVSSAGYNLLSFFEVAIRRNGDDELNLGTTFGNCRGSVKQRRQNAHKFFMPAAGQETYDGLRWVEIV